ncbi:MAG: NTP transferase domain-containing protein [Saprospiraceae bacterium]|nr:NTP transferase domain-containing protein [Saprospiraceae bacterium]
MKEKHQKHAKLARPTNGNFAGSEWAIMGTTCGNIQALTKLLAIKMTPQYKVGYVDADHKAGDEGAELTPFSGVYTDKIGYHCLDFDQKTIGSFQFRPLFNDTDVVLVNGNHFKAEQQIVVLDPKKMESLSRKLDRLTQIDAFLYVNTEGSDLANFKKMAGINEAHKWSDIPFFHIHEIDLIADYLKSKINKPPIKSLILVGGKSQRMGMNKATLQYHGKPQTEILIDILRGLDTAPYMSCRKEQAVDFIMDLAAENVPIITDTFLELGPFGAILSAFRHDPNAAWLVVACDLPLLDTETLDYLIKNRNLSAVATAFRSPSSKEGFPEPLITIWEPRAYPILLSFLAQGMSCPRKVLINSDSHLLDAPNPDALSNVNTPEEKAEIELKITDLEFRQ